MALKPGKYNPLKPDIELNDFKSKKRIGLKFDQGSGAFQVGTVSQDDSVHIRSAGKRIGDFDEQRSWKGGRGHENLSEAPEGFWDSENAWTLSDGFVMPTLLWQFARGLRNCEFYMPNKDRSMSWTPLIGNYRYVSVKFTASLTFSARYARMWIRRVGNPGTLTFRLVSNSGGDPGSTLEEVTVDTDDVTDTISVLELFDWGDLQALTSSTIYHVVIIGASTDSINNHWEVGGYTGGTNGKRSSAGSTWTDISFDAYYYIADEDVNRTFFSFTLNEAFYVVDKKDDGSTSKLWINGDRGVATSVSTNTLTDTARSWTANRWTDAYVKIVAGTGAGTVRRILSNTGNALTIYGTWAIDTTSQYIIYATEWFAEVSSPGLTSVKSEPINSNNIIYFPQGSTNIRRMIWTGSAYAFSDDGTNKAHFLEVLAAQGTTILALAYNDTNKKYVAVGTPTAWANPPTAITYGTQKEIGSGGYNITGVNQKDGLLYVLKEDSVFNMDKNLNTAMLQGGLEKTPFSENGLGNIAHQQFIFFSWMHSVIRIYGSSLDDIGQDWSGYGLPEGREGVFSSFDSYTSLLMAGVDADTGTSSVLGFDGIGWHEILRAYDANKRIRMVKVQVNPGTRNRTWVDCGGDLIFQEMPFMKGSPRLDSGVRYMHEAVIESGAIDMGTASGLPKYVKELAVFCKNLGSGNEIQMDYQVDDDVHTSTWTPASALYESPESVAFVGLEDIRKFAYRLRIRCADNSTPPMIEGVTPNGFARTPFKIVWTVRCRADNITSRGRLIKPDVLMRWLLDVARFPGRIQMTSQWELAHNFFVVIHPARMFPYKPATDGQAEESVFTLVIEEG